MINPKLSAEIAAACNALGFYDGSKYTKDRYCFETVKELIRHLRRDGSQHEARQMLGEAKVLQKDLIPLMKDYHDDKELFGIVLRLMVNLTHPVLLLYREEEPNDPQERKNYLNLLSHQQEYKKSFVDEDIFTVLSQKLRSLLEIDWTERDEDTNIEIERVLILVRNVLQVPADLAEEQRADNDASIHDQVLWVCHTSGINAIFLYLASTESEQPYFMHILEILSQTLREQNAAELATAAAERSLEERKRDESELSRLRQAEIEARQMKMKLLRGSRHSKFGGTYCLKNVKSISERDMIYHKPLNAFTSIDFDHNKTKVKTPKNRRADNIDVQERRSAYSIRLFLKELCIEFLSGAYNAVMYHVKDSLVRNKGQENDESYYLWALKFFMEFNRNYKFRIELVSETMSVQTFHWVQTQLDRCHEMLQTLKKNRRQWVKRQHLALKAYQELLMTLLEMDRSADEGVRSTARVIKSNIFYVLEYREMSQVLLQSFDPSKLPLNYLGDLLETNHVFLKMLEHFCKKEKIMVQKKKRKGGSKKKKPKKKVQEATRTEDIKTAEELWEEGLAEELSVVIQENPSLPLVAMPFDVLSEKSEDEQKIDCLKVIKRHMKERNFMEAIATLKAAIEIWPDLGSTDNGEMTTEDQFVALKDIFFAELPGEEQSEERAHEPSESEGERGAGSDDEEQDAAGAFAEIHEQNFNFEDFINRFAHPRVVTACCLMLRGFDKSGVRQLQVHAAIKLLHRICFDCKKPAMAFQASLFRTFQRAIKAQAKGGPIGANAKELADFAKYILQQFAKVSHTNPHIFLELLFWKTSRDAHDIVDGYGSYESSKTMNKNAWTEQQEDEIQRLATEFTAKMQEEQSRIDESALVDKVWENLIDLRSHSRIAVYKKMKELGLITGNKSISGRVSKWTDEDVEELTRLYNQYKNDYNPVQSIADGLVNKRSKQTIRKKLIEIGLATKEALACKKGKRRAGLQGRESDGSEEEGSSDEEEANQSRATQKFVYNKTAAIESVKTVMEKGMSSAVRWLMMSVNETIQDRTEDDDDEASPLIPMLEEDCDAMEDETFLLMLRKIGMAAPVEGQETNWRIPSELSVADLEERSQILAHALDGRLDSLLPPRDATPEPEPVPKTSQRRNRAMLESDDDSDAESTALLRKENNSANKRKRIDSSSDDDEEMMHKLFHSSTPAASEKAQAGKKKSRIMAIDSSDDEGQPEEPLTEQAASQGSQAEVADNEARETSDNERDSDDEPHLQIVLNSGSENDSPKKKRVHMVIPDDSD
ncbi:protein timeless homolog [Cloeon dipterum]|uniref:protein timeless homolog n=1 Tax=Cloeon dipterum TaxID=197152 RepID=UPI00321F78CB